MGRQTEAFPFEAVRDLLGIVRALYVAARRDGPKSRRAARIERVGRELRRALDMALEGGALTDAAWERAEKVVRELGELVDATTPMEPVLTAAGRRVKNGAPDRRKLRRLERIRRG